MLQLRWVLVAVLIIFSFGCVLGAGNDSKKRVKKQESTFSSNSLPDGSIQLIDNNRVLVYLVGFNAQKDIVGSNEDVQFGATGLSVLNRGTSSSRLNFPSVVNYTTISVTSVSKTVVRPTVATDSGPGALYTSDNYGVFVPRLSALPQNRSIIEQIIDQLRSTTATSLDVVVDSTGNTRITVDGNPFITVTGAETVTVGSTGGQQVTYMSDTITVTQDRGTQTFTGINNFGAFRFPENNPSNPATFNTFGTTTDETFLGPGQLFVNNGESTGLYIEDLSFRSGGTVGNILPRINSRIFNNTVNFEAVGNTVKITNNNNRPIITLTSSTVETSFFAPTTATYIGPVQTLTIQDGAGRIFTYKNIKTFSFFENNSVTTYTSSSGSPAPITFTTGGTLFVNVNSGEAFIVSNSNPVVVNELRKRVPRATETFKFNAGTDSKNVRFLSVAIRNVSSGTTQTEGVQILTGAYTTRVNALESVTYDNNAINISVANSKGESSLRLRIENVNNFVVNTGSIPYENYSTSSPISLIGPGTLSYSRGTAFFTSSPTLGNTIVSFSQSAPIPNINFDGKILENITIDDVNTTKKEATVTVGGDTVVSFEGTSYSTQPNQEILYEGNQISIYRKPITTTSVAFDSNTATGSYTNSTQSNVPLSGVTSFKVYTGGSVREITTPNNFTSSGPGNLYISDDGSKVLFTTSNVITTEVANVIRDTVPIDTTINVDQFSTITDNGIFKTYNLSANQATVLYPGGGVIFSSESNGTNLAFYVDIERIRTQIITTVSSILGVTKTLPTTNDGTVNVIFNGRVIYSYAPVQSNQQVLIGDTESFTFNGTALVGANLPDGPYTNINKVIYFNGIETKEFNSSDAPIVFEGRGLLLTKFNSDTAFYTTSPSSIQFLVAAFENQRRFLISPELQAPQEARVSTKLRSGTFSFGQNVAAFEGAAITFRCNVARANPSPTISFFRGNIMLNGTTQGEIISNDTLTLTNITASDSGDYSCVASNGVPPSDSLSSKLTVRNAVSPQLRPFSFPQVVDIGENEKLFWPTTTGNKGTVNVQIFDGLVFACRVEGRPKALVKWTLNGSPADTLPYAIVLEPQPGRSVLFIDITNDTEKMLFFMSMNPLNKIECSASNPRGSTSGSIEIVGSSFNCMKTSTSNCSTTCGFGIATISYECTESRSDMSDDRDVDPSTVPPDIPNPPSPVFDRCTTSDARGNTIICPVIEFEWNTTEWSGCSKSCGGGERTREASCLRLEIPVTARYLADINNTRITGVVNDSMCGMFNKAGARPTEREVCNREQCPLWRTSKFSDCSVTCGGGVSMRDVECNMIGNRSVNMNGKVEVDLTPVNDSFCNDSKKPKDTRQCNTFRCFFQWRVGAYGKCGDIPFAAAEFASCKYREIICYNYDSNLPSGTSQRVNDSFCDGLQRLLALTSCKGTCLFGFWDAGPWSNCSMACGYGMQTRSIQCLSPKSFTPVPLNFCDPRKTPATMQRCFVQNCRGMCQKDEAPTVCPLLANLNMCNMNVTMGLSGMRCCTSCMGMGGAD